MAERPPEGELQRQPRRILPLLAMPDAVACRLPPRRYGGPARVAIRLPGTSNTSKKQPHVDLSVIEALAASDLVSRDGPERWRISQSGIAWVDGQCAGENVDRARHRLIEPRTIEAPDRVRRMVQVNSAESPLEWLRGRKDRHGGSFLSQSQFEAGERLRRDFTVAGMAPSVTANWSTFHLPRMTRRGDGAGAGASMHDTALAARQRVQAALGAVGPELSGLLIDVCCLLTGLEDAERSRSWPKRSAKVVLRLALDQLSRHYGPEEPARASRRSHRWGRPGYRPSIARASPQAAEDGSG